MWTQSLTPLGNPWLSALVAALPIIVFLVCMTALKMKGTTAGAIALVVAFLVAIVPLQMPINKALGAAGFGVLNAIWPIGWIVFMALWLYRLSVSSGKFDVIRESIASISNDQRVQVLIIAFAFNAFLEGAAGFGVPIAICAAMLVQLGFKPVKAAMLCLVANIASGAYGAIGIPVITAAKVGEVDPHAVNIGMILSIQLLTAFIPALLVLILNGFKGLRQLAPMVIIGGVVFSGGQCLVLATLGPELADIIPPLITLLAFVAFMHFWQPKEIYREESAPAIDPNPKTYHVKQIASAWSPFYILSIAILVWSIPAVKALFMPADPVAKTATGALTGTVFNIPIPGLDGQVMAAGAKAANAAVWSWTPINATGTAILLAVLITWLTSKSITPAMLAKELKGTWDQLWRPLVLIIMIMAIAYIENFSGASSIIGSALTGVGHVFPLLSPLIGWLGVFITGSVVNANNLFAKLQVVTGHGIGVDPSFLVAANTAGGSIGKAVSPQSIAIAAAAVGLSGQESKIMRAALKYSLYCIGYLALWTLLLSFFL